MEWESLLALAQEFVQNGVNAADRYDIDIGKKVTAEHARRSGRDISEVRWELSMANAKRKAKFCEPN